MLGAAFGPGAATIPILATNCVGIMKQLAQLPAPLRQSLANDWAAVRKLTSSKHVGGIVFAAFVSYEAPKGFLNLPLMLAYSVLDQLLGELVAPGKKRRLGDLMEESLSGCLLYTSP